MKFRSAVFMMSGTGLYRPRNSGDGAGWAGKVKTIKEFCFVMEIRGSERLILGNRDKPRGKEE